jgi:hypothetical protein
MDTGINMADKLWDIANFTTGFAVAQSIATSFAIAKHEFKALKGKREHNAGIAATLVFNLFYTVIIVWCGYKGSSFDSEKGNSGIWFWVTLGRFAAVFLFTGVVVAAFLGNLKDTLEKECAKN